MNKDSPTTSDLASLARELAEEITELQRQMRTHSMPKRVVMRVQADISAEELERALNAAGLEAYWDVLEQICIRRKAAPPVGPNEAAK